MGTSATCRRVVCAGLLSAGLMLGGCKDIKKKSLDEARQAEEAQAVAAAVRAQADRLEALRLQEERRKQPVPQVTWLDKASLHSEPAAPSAPAPKPPVAASNTAPMQGDVVKTAANVGVEPLKAVAPVQAVSLKDVGRDALMAQLLSTLRQEPGDAMTRAVNISTLLGFNGKAALDPRDLQPLSDAQRSRLQQYHELMALLRQQMISPTGQSQDQAIMERLDGIMNDVPLHIRKVELARSVSSYGVLEPMETHTFLAGRPQPVIVYVELEHFKAIKGDGGKFAVKLSQELVLYNETDGLAVWREPRVQIADESLNRRRDFFVVQRIELPARLSVGKYLLKITMTDTQGGSIDETSLPIQIVADATLVKKVE